MKLLEQLKNTQAAENMAFSELEAVMVEAAKFEAPQRGKLYQDKV